MAAIPKDIYQMILNSLHITYTPDESTVKRLENEIASGTEYIQKYCSPAADCRPGTVSGQLLCEYVLRAEAGALETFPQDFAEEITSLGIESRVSDYAEAMGYAQEKK